jgi:hypothetical protein
MTPQQLMDMPFAGMAEAKLRKMGKWRLTTSERIDKALLRLRSSIEDAQEYVDDLEDAMEANE